MVMMSTSTGGWCLGVGVVVMMDGIEGKEKGVVVVVLARPSAAAAAVAGEVVEVGVLVVLLWGLLVLLLLVLMAVAAFCLSFFLLKTRGKRKDETNGTFTPIFFLLKMIGEASPYSLVSLLVALVVGGGRLVMIKNNVMAG